MSRKLLLICGIAAMVWYIIINIIVPGQDPVYHIASQTVSELSAIGAPTRGLWVMLCLFYTLLFLGFGVGIWLSAHGNKNLKMMAVVVIVDAVIGIFWPPMHQRQVLASGGGTLTDTLHVAWAFVHLALILLMIWYGSVAFKTIRVFSVLIVVIFLVFGVLTTIESPGLEAGTPTPYIGIWERINMGAYMLWVVVFAYLMIRREHQFRTGPLDVAGGLKLSN